MNCEKWYENSNALQVLGLGIAILVIALTSSIFSGCNQAKVYTEPGSAVKIDGEWLLNSPVFKGDINVKDMVISNSESEAVITYDKGLILFNWKSTQHTGVVLDNVIVGIAGPLPNVAMAIIQNGIYGLVDNVFFMRKL